MSHSHKYPDLKNILPNPFPFSPSSFSSSSPLSLSSSLSSQLHHHQPHHFHPHHPYHTIEHLHSVYFNYSPFPYFYPFSLISQVITISISRGEGKTQDKQFFSLIKVSYPFCRPFPHRKMTQIWLFESRPLFSIYKFFDYRQYQFQIFSFFTTP